MKNNFSKSNYSPITPPEFNGLNCVKVKSVTIGAPGVSGCDANFAADANTTEQVISFTDLFPAKALIKSVFSITDSAFTFSGGATTLVAEAGSSSSGNQFISSATIYAANAVTNNAAGSSPLAAPSTSAVSLHVAATPGANWSTMTGGKVTYFVEYLDVTGIK